MLTVGQEGSRFLEINVYSETQTVIFTADGEYLVRGDEDGVEVRRVEDGWQMAKMAARDVQCLAASKDGRWIAAGTGPKGNGMVFMWDAKTFERVFSHKEDELEVCGVEFSPDSTRLVTASKKATVWDVTTREPVLTLPHEDIDSSEILTARRSNRDSFLL
jgi:WD40 repeat protein